MGGGALATHPSVTTGAMAFPAFMTDFISSAEKPAPSIDDQLVARAVTGDRIAFRELYTRHRSAVARLVFRLGLSNAELEDAIQEVFIQVHKSLKDFRGQSKFSTWLHRVTVNVVLMHRRALRSRPSYAEEPKHEPAADSALPDEDAETAERLRAFRRILDRLGEKKRDVFVLHDLEGVAPAEIAQIVGAPVLTVRTRLFYARRELEGMLSEEPALASVRGALLQGDADKSGKAVGS